MSVKQAYKNHKFSSLIITGLVATLGFYIAAYIDMAVTGVPLDISAVLGMLVVGEHESAQVIGNLFHIGNGIGLTLFFGYAFFPISNRLMKGRVWLHGIIFGVIVTATTVWFGMLPALGAGIAGVNIAPEVPVMTMTRHIVFGAILGILSKPILEAKN